MYFPNQNSPKRGWGQSWVFSPRTQDVTSHVKQNVAGLYFLLLFFLCLNITQTLHVWMKHEGPKALHATNRCFRAGFADRAQKGRLCVGHGCYRVPCASGWDSKGLAKALTSDHLGWGRTFLHTYFNLKYKMDIMLYWTKVETSDWGHKLIRKEVRSRVIFSAHCQVIFLKLVVSPPFKNSKECSMKPISYYLHFSDPEAHSIFYTVYGTDMCRYTRNKFECSQM